MSKLTIWDGFSYVSGRLLLRPGWVRKLTFWVGLAGIDRAPGNVSGRGRRAEPGLFKAYFLGAYCLACQHGQNRRILTLRQIHM